jgi:hypothetical protein
MNNCYEEGEEKKTKEKMEVGKMSKSIIRKDEG